MIEYKLVCPFCGRCDFKNKSGLTQHIKHCKHNPNGIPGYNTGQKRTPEQIANIRNNTTYHRGTEHAMYGRTGDKSPMYGKHQTEEAKQKLRECNIGDKNPMYGKHHNEESKQKIKNSNSGEKCYWYNKHLSDETKQKISDTHKGKPLAKEHIQRIYNTKKQNNTFNTSKIEYELKNYFDSNNILYMAQYKSNLYPFSCDFYFPDKDLYVEIQGCWTHGGKPYIYEDEDCIRKLELWKSKNTKFYDNAIKTWTVRDVRKRNIAKQNNLNWIEIFSCNLDECINIILSNL